MSKGWKLVCNLCCQVHGEFTSYSDGLDHLATVVRRAHHRGIPEDLLRCVVLVPIGYHFNGHDWVPPPSQEPSLRHPPGSADPTRAGA